CLHEQGVLFMGPYSHADAGRETKRRAVADKDIQGFKPGTHRTCITGTVHQQVIDRGWVALQVHSLDLFLEKTPLFSDICTGSLQLIHVSECLQGKRLRVCIHAPWRPGSLNLCNQIRIPETISKPDAGNGKTFGE